MKLGAHVSVAGGLELAPDRALQIGCEAMQIFSRNQRQWLPPPLDKNRCSAYQQAFKDSGLNSACTHASYLINLAAPDKAIWKKSIAAMADELTRAELLSIPFVVVHPGAHKGDGVETGWQRVAKAAEEAFRLSKTKNVKLLLENTAGQGTYLGSELEQLAHALNLIGDSARMGICLDTCHLFAAGYKITDEVSYQTLKQEISATIGIRNVLVIHLNDSAKPFASHVDNHAAIGKGLIGSKPFSFWVNDPSWKNTLGILETPGGEINYKRELRLLKQFRLQAST